MPTLFYDHPACLDHDTGAGHPERSDRLRAVTRIVNDPAFASLERREAPRGTLDDILRVHPQDYTDKIRATIPAAGVAMLDNDTIASPGTGEAALRAVGAGVAAVDAVMAGVARNAFCAVRPPGHHAETARAMGFCLFNNVAIAAKHLRAVHGLARVAVVDFDVHHGNGTQEIFWDDSGLFFGSSHQMPLFPGTGDASERGQGNIVNAPLAPGDGAVAFKRALDATILPALHDFRPNFVIISAGFDAHRRDPLAQIELDGADFGWATREILRIADQTCDGRVIAMLEGGYDLVGLADGLTAHLAALRDAADQ